MYGILNSESTGLFDNITAFDLKRVICWAEIWLMPLTMNTLLNKELITSFTKTEIFNIGMTAIMHFNFLILIICVALCTVLLICVVNFNLAVL